MVTRTFEECWVKNMLLFQTSMNFFKINFVVYSNWFYKMNEIMKWRCVGGELITVYQTQYPISDHGNIF